MIILGAGKSGSGGGGLSPNTVIHIEANPLYCFSNDAGTTPCGHNSYVRSWRDKITGEIIFYTNSNDNAPIFKEGEGGTYWVNMVSPHCYLLGNAADGNLSALFDVAATVCYVYDINFGSEFCAIGSTGVSSSNHWDRFADASSYQALLRVTRHESQPVIPTGSVTHTVRSNASNYSRRINGTEDISYSGSWGTAAVNQWVLGYNGANQGDLKGNLYGMIATSAYEDSSSVLAIEAHLESLRG